MSKRTTIFQVVAIAVLLIPLGAYKGLGAGGGDSVETYVERWAAHCKVDATDYAEGDKYSDGTYLGPGNLTRESATTEVVRAEDRNNKMSRLQGRIVFDRYYNPNTGEWVPWQVKAMDCLVTSDDSSKPAYSDTEYTRMTEAAAGSCGVRPDQISSGVKKMGIETPERALWFSVSPSSGLTTYGRDVWVDPSGNASPCKSGCWWIRQEFKTGTKCLDG